MHSNEDLTEAVGRVLAGALGVVHALERAAADLQDEIDAVKAALAEPSPEDFELGREAMQPGVILRPEHMAALGRLRDSGRTGEILLEPRAYVDVAPELLEDAPPPLDAFVAAQLGRDLALFGTAFVTADGRWIDPTTVQVQVQHPDPRDGLCWDAPSEHLAAIHEAIVARERAANARRTQPYYAGTD